METTHLLVVLLLVTWLVGGLVVAVFMRRAGRDFGLWVVLGVLLGPFSAFFAPPARRRATLTKTRNRPGRLDVLAGVDGSPESLEAVRLAAQLFGGSMTSLTLATVLDEDSAHPYSDMAEQARAVEELTQVARQIDYSPIEFDVSFGAPATVLSSLASEGEFELIVVGARGRGMSEYVFGSVARALVDNPDVPVFVGPKPTADAERMEPPARTIT